MAAPQRVTEAQIMAALIRCRGNVAWAAQELGIHRNNLDKRICAMGVKGELAALRKGGTRVVSMPPVQPNDREGGASPYARKQQVPSFLKSAPGPILQGMSAAAPVAPFPERPRRPNIRIRPDHVDALVEARFDLIAALRQEVSEQDILERFLSESLRPWLERQVTAARGVASAQSDDEAARG